ncbi:putative bifunctional diguanylate cyclase/phosphodiesterase [Sphingomonas sp.]|jgi:diguanylate cyclase (GGDEF)-like protein|uniref:putative bifunctional diguanylate cyclase/phosphodiesterase n=1 Tax=Sphingomonas sp. TaxID=28214 RepID=UPI002EDA5411
MRADQLDAARVLAPWIVVAHVLGAAIVAWIHAGQIATFQIAAWSAALAATAGLVALRRTGSRHRGDPDASLAMVRATAIEGLALAAVWAAAPVLLHAGTRPQTGIWLVVSVMMTAAAIGAAPMAIAACTFIATLGVAVAVQLAIVTDYPAAVAVLAIAAMLCAACIARARALGALRVGRRTLDERDQTVSLLLREFEDGGADWLWETDASRRVVRANARLAKACGLQRGEIDGMPILQVLAGPSWESGNFAAGLHTLAAKLKARESFRDLRLPVIVGDQERWWEIAASPRYDENGGFCGFRGVGSDVTEQRASADKINRMARYDTLTGLPNRLMLNEALVRAMAEAEKWGSRCAFMMLDLDRFKAVNDTLGHPIGDRLLQRVAKRLAQLMGAGDLCGRLGGDEFGVVVRDAGDTEAVEALAQRIIDSLSRPYEVDQHTLHVGTSVGVAIGPRDGRTAEMLIRSADLALYRSKDAGGGVFHAYEPQLHAQAEERRVLEMALRTALERGEMHLNYQPVVDAGTGSLTGFEALLRWTSPDLGIVSPVKFVPLAEEARLIGPIGEWVLRTACEEAARWPGHLRVAVNVSAEQLQSPAFVATVASALANSGLPAERLELEVTESVFMQGTQATKVLERIIDLGVRLSLDDFGTGYSSLGYLSRTRFSSIKIDRSFVTAASKGVREAIAIIRAVVALARSLGMATTAEGVENEAEHAMVQDFGCTKVQGYYFGRPLPVEEARRLACRDHDAAKAA